MAKITDMLPANVSVDSYFINDEIKFISDPLPKIEESVFNTAFKALRLKKTLKLQYRTISTQEYSERTFDPYHVICQKGSWYVIGYNHEKGSVRVYTMARMKDLQLTDETFKIPADFKIEDHIDLSFGIWNSTQEIYHIELQFEKNVSTLILERTWHKNQTIKQNKDGSVYLSFDTNQIEETLHWILQFCGYVKVLNPPILKEKMIEAAERILKNSKCNRSCP